MMTKTQFISLLLSEYAYEHYLVSYIDAEGRQIYPPDHSYDTYCANILRLLASQECTIKVEQLERYSEEMRARINELAFCYLHDGPITVHAFMAFPNSPSFGMHTDPYPVYIQCIHGTKNLLSEGDCIELDPGHGYYFETNIPHEAINKKESIILSFGFEPFINKQVTNELGSVHKND